MVKFFDWHCNRFPPHLDEDTSGSRCGFLVVSSEVGCTEKDACVCTCVVFVVVTVRG